MIQMVSLFCSFRLEVNSFDHLTCENRSRSLKLYFEIRISMLYCFTVEG